MPISACGDCTAQHWSDVLSIITEVSSEEGYDTRLVSETYESSLIHKEIMQNIYTDELVICDVSERNPNVMFELGIRMATQKPVLLIKDDKTDYPFDTSPNRYLEYPRDLRFNKIVDFKEALKDRIKKTIKEKPTDSFIGNLGSFEIPVPSEEEIPMSSELLSFLNRMEHKIEMLRRPIMRPSMRDRNFKNRTPNHNIRTTKDGYDVCVKGISPHCGKQIVKNLSKLNGNLEIDVKNLYDNHFHLIITKIGQEKIEIEDEINNEIIKHYEH